MPLTRFSSRPALSGAQGSAMTDVIVVGAGPAGTAATYDLLSGGCSVLLLDRSAPGREKACAGGITPKTLDLFRYDISKTLLQACDRVRIVPFEKKPFMIREDRPVCHMCDRRRLDLLSVETVIGRGATFRQIGKIDAITQSSETVHVRCGRDRFVSRFLIGADGANSAVRRFTDAAGPPGYRAFAVEADIRVSRPERHPMTFEFTDGLAGYFWLFPKQTHVNTGIYMVKGARKDAVRKLAHYAGRRLGRVRLDSVRGYPIGIGGHRCRAADRRILLVGDAAGMAEPLLGEGLYGAVKSGQNAAGAIIRAVESDGGGADQYYRSLIAPLKRDLSLYEPASRWFYRFGKISLALLKYRMIHRPFSAGFAAGRPLSAIIKGVAPFPV